MADPFRDEAHGVPMTAITRTTGIDLMETIGEWSPDRVGPRREVLW